MKVLYTVYTRKSLQQQHGEYLHPVSNSGRYSTPEEAEKAAEEIRSTGAWANVGKFYIYTSAEYNNIGRDFKGTHDGVKSTMINGPKGATLIFENLHFEIV